MKCARCGKPLDRKPLMIGGNALGPKCARAMFGVKKREKREPVKRDTKTLELFA